MLRTSTIKETFMTFWLTPLIYTLYHTVRRRPSPTQGSRAAGDDDHIGRLFVNYVFALKLFVSKCNVLPVLIAVPFHEGISTCGTAAAHILTFGQRWGWVDKFTPPPLYPPGRAPIAKLIGSSVGPIVGLDFRNTENLLDLQGTKHFLGLPVRRVITVCLIYPGCLYIHVPMLICRMEVLTARCRSVLIIGSISGAVSGGLYCIPCRHLTHDAPTSWLTMGCRYPTRQGLVILFQVT